MKSNLEKRKIDTSVSFKERTIEGKAICFNTDSRNLGFIEQIKPEAATAEFLDTQEIYMLFNHDGNDVLGRSKKGVGNLSYDVRDDGVYFKCKLFDNTVANDALSYIEAGLADGCSFGFIVDPEKEEWEWENGVARRTIRGFKQICEFSVVFDPAYVETSVSCRSYNDFLKESYDELRKKVNCNYDELRKKISASE